MDPETKTTTSFACQICSKTFKWKGNLTTHVRIHTRPFTCLHCNLKFATQKRLTEHEQVHSMERKYACSKCTYRFPTESFRRAHMTRCHPRKCMHCQLEFFHWSTTDEFFQQHVKSCAAKQQTVSPPPSENNCNRTTENLFDRTYEFKLKEEPDL